MDKFDVIVVGAGSSGGVVAARLTENASRSVLLIEAGPDFPQEQAVPPLFTVSGEHHWRCAGGIPEFDWDFVNTDGAGTLGGRSLRVPRGRLVGGTSMVNATIAARGAPFDFDRFLSWEIRPRLDQQNAARRVFGQTRRDDAAARSRADDNDVELVHERSSKRARRRGHHCVLHSRRLSRFKP